MTQPPLLDVALWDAKLSMQTRPDGTIIIDRTDPLGTYDTRLTDRIDHWAAKTPDHTWMAQRDDAVDWRRISYGQLAQMVRHAGQWVLDAGLSTDRPLAILRANSLEHAVAALAAQYVGVPSAAIAPAYSLIADDFGKLAEVMAKITPGAVLVDDAAAYANAIAGGVPADVHVIAMTGHVDRTPLHILG